VTNPRSRWSRTVTRILLAGNPPTRAPSRIGCGKPGCCCYSHRRPELPAVLGDGLFGGGALAGLKQGRWNGAPFPCPDRPPEPRRPDDRPTGGPLRRTAVGATRWYKALPERRLTCARCCTAPIQLSSTKAGLRPFFLVFVFFIGDVPALVALAACSTFSSAGRGRAGRPPVHELLRLVESERRRLAE